MASEQNLWSVDRTWWSKRLRPALTGSSTACSFPPKFRTWKLRRSNCRFYSTTVCLSYFSGFVCYKSSYDEARPSQAEAFSRPTVRPVTTQHVHFLAHGRVVPICVVSSLCPVSVRLLAAPHLPSTTLAIQSQPTRTGREPAKSRLCRRSGLTDRIFHCGCCESQTGVYTCAVNSLCPVYFSPPATVSLLSSTLAVPSLPTTGMWNLPAIERHLEIMMNCRRGHMWAWHHWRFLQRLLYLNTKSDPNTVNSLFLLLAIFTLPRLGASKLVKSHSYRHKGWRDRTYRCC